MLHMGWSEISALVSGMSGLFPLVLESTMSDRCSPAREDLTFATEKRDTGVNFLFTRSFSFSPLAVWVLTECFCGIPATPVFS